MNKEKIEDIICMFIAGTIISSILLLPLFIFLTLFFGLKILLILDLMIICIGFLIAIMANITDNSDWR